jgi:hypothetical protein
MGSTAAAGIRGRGRHPSAAAVRASTPSLTGERVDEIMARVTMAMLSTLAMVANTSRIVDDAMTGAAEGMDRMSPGRSLRASALEQAVAEAFRGAGWRVVAQPRIAGIRPDLVVRRGNLQYVVEIKSSAEPRRDRLVPLLAQAILEAKLAASKADLSPPPRPLAVVGAANLPASLIDDLRSFAQQVAPDVSIGIVDFDGSQVFVGPHVEELSRVVRRARHRPRAFAYLGPKLDLFSDLNQWMLKVLLAPGLPENLMHAPREEVQSASDLARVAGVSVMSASRCLRLLRSEGFLADSHPVRLVNRESLFQRWRAAFRKPFREVPMRWAIPGDPRRQLSESVRGYVKEAGSARRSRRGRHIRGVAGRPRMCVGLFAAAELMGFTFVHGVAPHLYVEWLDPAAFESLGLVPAASGQHPDVFVRVPAFRESMFRPTVMHAGIPASDILQVWLDVSDHPARGASQAQEIWRRVLASLVKHARS